MTIVAKGALHNLRGSSAWTVLTGSIRPAELRVGAAEVALRHRLQVAHPDTQTLIFTRPGDHAAGVTVRWHPTTPARPDTLSHVLNDTHLEILLDHSPDAADAFDDLTEWLHAALRRYTPEELVQIAATMPLLARYATASTSVADWAVIFRDHYVENTLGFLLALQQSGVPARWIYALTKGDRTHNRGRIHATLLSQGCASGLLDSTTINVPESHAAELALALAGVDTFIDAARAAGRRILVIDDGGLLAQGYGRSDAPRRVDAALELTVSGLKRITAAGPLGIPVLNLARSQLKTHLGYPEIADSCIRRLRTLLPAIKVRGRTVLILGYGTLGSRLAAALRDQGCQVHVVDPNPLALITAAEAGHPTYRSAREALRALHAFLIIGTTGEDALTPAELPLLNDGTFLAPFATRDFSILAETGHSLHVAEIPGIGRRYHLTGRRQVTLLGDGRSLNLFEADAIPNQGYDAYRAGTLIAADFVCAQADNLEAGLHNDLVDEVIGTAGLYDAYYDTYLATKHAPVAQTPGERPRTMPVLAAVPACVIGYGAAGRLHAEILAGEGAELIILDPKHQDLPKAYQTFHHGIDELPAAVFSQVGLWSVCCPTTDHLPVLRSILTKDPRARVLLEKPACQSHEIDAFSGLLSAHPNARIMVTNQYQHARTLDLLTELMARFEPGAEPDHIAITFSKDRTGDIARGRFIDRSYGVLGYEWLHMLAVLRRLLPAAATDAYYAADPHGAELWATYDRRMFVSALTERTEIPNGDTRLHIELSSSITGPTIILGNPPPTPSDMTTHWQRDLRPADDRHRHVTVHAGKTRFTARFDPVTALDGWQLDRNAHHVTVEQANELVHDEVVHDSPLHTGILHAATTLISPRPVATPDLSPLRRIAALAELLRAQQPTDQGGNTPT